MKTQWTLKRLFLWIFIAALVLPYLINLVPRSINPLIGFSVNESDVYGWIKEADPTVRSLGGGGGGGSSNEASESEFDYLFSLSERDDEKVMSILRGKVEEKIQRGTWMVTTRTTSNDSFAFVFSNGFSKYRVYVWNVPISKAEAEQEANSGKNYLRIKVLTIGYTTGSF